MTVRQVAKQFCWLGEVHNLIYGRRTSGKNGGENDRKLTTSTRVGSQSRLMDYLGLPRLTFIFLASSPQDELPSTLSSCRI